MQAVSTERLGKLRRQLRQSGLGALIVTGPENRRYLSGFSGSSGWLLVSDALEAVVTDGRYWAQVEQECPGWELLRFRHQDHKRLSRALAEWLSNRDVGRVGFEKDQVTYDLFEQLQEDLPDVDLVPCSGLVEELRQVKDAGELQLLREAAAAADRAFAQMLKKFKEGVCESELCAELEYLLQREGARKPSFDTILASGPNGAFPHAGVTDRPIQAGELVTLDFGALREGYASDITRTIWLGELPELERTVYRVVRQAQQAALDAVRPGITGGELDSAARQIIDKAGYGEAFSHSLGHGIGLAVHEAPTLRSITETPLEAGMVVTIEPGIYLPGKTGCRVEDTVIVTEDGFEFVTHAPKQELGQAHPLG